MPTKKILNFFSSGAMFCGAAKLVAGSKESPQGSKPATRMDEERRQSNVEVRDIISPTAVRICRSVYLGLNNLKGK